jgi:hypothetical protein
LPYKQRLSLDSSFIENNENATLSKTLRIFLLIFSSLQKTSRFLFQKKIVSFIFELGAFIFSMIQILKIIGYSIGMGVLSGILFFGIGLYLEVETRPTETVLKYDRKKKEYKRKNVVADKDISGDMTAYLTMAGILIGIVGGVILALDKSKDTAPNSVPSETTVKKTPPKIP